MARSLSIAVHAFTSSVKYIYLYNRCKAIVRGDANDALDCVLVLTSTGAVIIDIAGIAE